MSVSIVMLPVALGLRVVMGAENFDAWVRSMEVNYRTIFTSQTDLVRTVRKAGYDALPYAGMIKTHITGKDDFFFWEQAQDGSWIASISKYIAPAVVRRFMSDLEARAGRELFIVDRETETAASAAVPKTSIYPTNFRDGTLLLGTLSQYGMQPRQQANGEIHTTIGGSGVVFRPGQAGAPYTVEIGDTPELRGVFEQLSRIDERYKAGVQQQSIGTLRERIAERNLTIEREEVLPDRSVVFTLNIGA